MRLVLTVHRYWPSIGGTETLVEGLAEWLARKGHDVTLATSSEPGAPAQEDRNGVHIRRFELVRRGKFRVPHGDYRAFVKRTDDRDLLVAHGQRVWSTDYAYDILRRTPTPVVAMFHGFYQYHMNGFRPPEWVYYHRILGPAVKRRHVVAQTEGEVDELVRFGVPRERVGLIPAPMDVAQFQREPAPSGFRARHGFASDEPLLLYVGGFYANKRVDDAVRIAARTGHRLAVIGRDPDPASANQRRCEALARELGARVSFLGKVAWDDVLSAYHEATLLLLPASFEGYGLVLLEAMASGLPFVASRAGAAPELAASGAGASVDGWEAMAREVTALVEDKEKRGRMGAIGRERARRQDLDTVAAMHEAFYERAVREQRR